MSISRGRLHIQVASNPSCCIYFRKIVPLRESRLINKVLLRQRQRLRGLRRTPHPIRLNAIRLRVDRHLRPRIVELHVPLAYVAAIFDRLDALAQLVRVDDARVDGRFRHESHAG
jgi:hypothetical protein